MSADQTPVEKHPGILTNTVSDPHINGHLVYTGMYTDDLVQQLFIHKSLMATSDHVCDVYSYFEEDNSISYKAQGQSADFTVIEHGWFRDVDIIREICTNHPIPHGENPEEVFIEWRDSLLDFLNTTHSGGLWTPIP